MRPTEVMRLGYIQLQVMMWVSAAAPALYKVHYIWTRGAHHIQYTQYLASMGPLSYSLSDTIYTLPITPLVYLYKPALYELQTF